MKSILFSALMAFALMSLTTGCSMMGEGGSKCGASHNAKCGGDKKASKCGGDKKEVQKEAKKCGENKDGKCGSAK
jgi:hypothetical protein